MTDRVQPLQSNQLEELINKLRQDIPKSLSVMATVYHMASGRLEGNVYTNGWPNFTTVVAQYKGGFGQWFFCCYTSSANNLCQLLHGTKLILSTQKNTFLVESTFVDEFLKNFKFADTNEVTKFSCEISTYHYYLPEPIRELKDCLKGFAVRKLEEHHADAVSEYWTHSDNLEAKKNHFKSLIKRFHSVGVFSVEDDDTPIAWSLQHPFGQPAHLYVTETYRRHGFASLVLERMCKLIQEDGLVPEICVEWCNKPAKALMKKTGFVEHEEHKLMSITNDSSINYVF